MHTIPVRLCNYKMENHVNLLMIPNRYFPKVNDFECGPMGGDF